MKGVNEIFENAKTIDDSDELVESLLQNEDIKKIIMDNDLGNKTIISSMNVLLNYVDDTFINKDGIKESKTFSGMKPTLHYDNETIFVEYSDIYKKDKKPKMFSIQMPEELTKAKLEDYSLISEQRRNLYHYARTFINSFSDEKPLKGMYIYGQFRSGKTFIAAAIGNELADKGKNVIMVYYPELSSYLKSLIGDDEFQNEINRLKNCDLLILDDFGGEAVNPFIRDEALGVVLNYRMIKGKPIIITSNIPMGRLKDTSLIKDGSEGERIKAMRIYNRIHEMTTEYIIEKKFEEYR
ncbi:MAG: ATP-binding protein [Gammaproteobacteria bacterium]|nr:ATP-binding protein [Gammaproteobacteria bacterium]